MIDDAVELSRLYREAVAKIETKRKDEQLGQLFENLPVTKGDENETRNSQ